MATQRNKKTSNPTKSDAFDPYEPQRHKRGRKSHLAAAINQNSRDNPGMGWVWAAILIVLLVGTLLLAVLKK